MDASWKADRATSVALQDGVKAALEAAGLHVRSGRAGNSVLLTGRGVGMCELRFRLDRPAHLKPGEPWRADDDADALVAVALDALASRYVTTRSLTGRQTLLVVRARSAADGAAELPQRLVGVEVAS